MQNKTLKIISTETVSIKCHMAKIAMKWKWKWEWMCLCWCWCWCLCAYYVTKKTLSSWKLKIWRIKIGPKSRPRSKEEIKRRTKFVSERAHKEREVDEYKEAVNGKFLWKINGESALLVRTPTKHNWTVAWIPESLCIVLLRRIKLMTTALFLQWINAYLQFGVYVVDCSERERRSLSLLPFPLPFRWHRWLRSKWFYLYS